MSADYEKLGLFYLGKQFDLDTGARLDDLVLYDSRDLRWLVQQIQRPTFESIGVLDLETFFPARERQKLALRFNSVLAAPGFDAWSAGEPLDAAGLLFTPEGKPRIAIISVAHLDDQQRRCRSSSTPW